MEKEKNTRKKVIVLSVVLIILGIIIIGWEYFLSKKDYVYQEMRIKLTYNSVIVNPDKDVSDDILNDSDEDLNINNNDTPNETPVTPSKPKPTRPSYNYIGYIEIPSINIKKGLVDKNSVYNNVNYNVQIMKESSYPDVDKGLFILAAHNGTCYNCYFKHLDNIKNNDLIYVNYKNKKYTYKVAKKYTVNKTGYVSIYRNNDVTSLALVTCTWGTKNKQTVVIAELINKE